MRQKNDEWFLGGIGWLDFDNNFREEDAIYRGDCCSHFQSGKKKARIYIGTSSWKRERPTINQGEEAFQEMNVEY